MREAASEPASGLLGIERGFRDPTEGDTAEATFEPPSEGLTSGISREIIISCRSSRARYHWRYVTKQYARAHKTMITLTVVPTMALMYSLYSSVVVVVISSSVVVIETVITDFWGAV
jgi:hypothetical protein